MGPAELPALLRAIDREERHGGVIPLERVRARLGLPRAAADALLLAGQDGWHIDLKIANDPARLARPDDAIATRHGLAAWAVSRT